MLCFIATIRYASKESYLVSALCFGLHYPWTVYKGSQYDPPRYVQCIYHR